MKRSKVTWSNSVDEVEGPCAVCGKEVRFVIPDDRPDPAILYHSTCDVMPLLRERLKKSTPALLSVEYTVPKKIPLAKPAVAASTAPAPTQPPPSTTPPAA